MSDFIAIATRMKNSGAPLFGRFVKAVVSDAIAQDLMNDDKFFAAEIRSALSAGKNLQEGTLVPYRGIMWQIDDEPFCENWGAPLVRARTAAPIHTAFIYAQSAFAYLKLGSKSAAKPKFKVQDISKTGKETTIGYTVPFQTAVVRGDWSATLTGPVSDWQTND
jgi:hypothetical protein